ncbi:thioredoxin family protein [Pseudomonas frederiksbergensis]|uniref:thioredoxin family protein n=1 Tax=Pseudomonas frederiksbergensis TaxID=104087 RepID=UPI000F4716FC|nr:thioredoxin domain-containing protein [Pseudomonas frederiksbergensis]RON44079.1 hypothetical protein BK667_28040 [Pseudomonas frederiksbergensis]
MSVSTVNDGNFDAEVLQSALPVIVEFASGVKASARMSTVIDQLAAAYDGRIKVVRKELDTAGSTEKKFDIQSAPTTLFVKSGQEFRQVVGQYSLDWMSGRADELLQA